MRPLDEVIKGFECCKEVGCGECPYKILFDDDSHVPCDQFEKDDDALQWLKGYKAHIELDKLRDKYGGTSQKLRNTSQITCPKCHSEFVILDDPDGDHAQLLKCQALLQEFYRNDPLTWNELKTMEGRPVWIETDNVKFWTVVDNFRTICNQECLCCSKGYMCRSTYMRGDWQAYRKERS